MTTKNIAYPNHLELLKCDHRIFVEIVNMSDLSIFKRCRHF